MRASVLESFKGAVVRLVFEHSDIKYQTSSALLPIKLSKQKGGFFFFSPFFFCQDSFDEIMSEIVFGEVYVPQSDPPNILTVGPFGFDNEPVLSPGLVLPTGIARVVSLVLKAYWFPTSTVRLAYFPWMLQTDVTLAALFLREVARLCRADWIFPTDSAGILVVAKLAVMLAEEGGKENELLLAALQRSMQWPPRYPPPHLSKLMPGHEQFSPPEAVVSESDELHFPQGPDRERVATAVRTVGAHSFAKREYSEASRGVARDDEGSVDSAFRAVQRVFARGAGVAAFDQSLKVAIFLQQEVPLDSGVMPVGVRFFAKAGKLIAAHSSESIETNVVYKTVRDETVEKRTIELLKGWKCFFFFFFFFFSFFVLFFSSHQLHWFWLCLVVEKRWECVFN